MPASIIAVSWTSALTAYCAVSFILFKKKADKIKRTAGELQDKFLLCEVISRPQRSEDALYYELMLLQGRAAIERVKRAEREKADYYDYLETWVHEIKTPIAAAGLVCDIYKEEAFIEISRQLAKIDNYVEQVLYQAKAANSEKDLFIKETRLADIVNDCIKENKQLFVDSGISISVEADGTVITDDKWLRFIIKQILMNSVQYKREDNAQIRLYTGNAEDGRLYLIIFDNGAGILESEINRIFDKGFTGSNGRRNKKSTGLGLYLCKKLCGVLGIDITAESVAGEYTKIMLSLPYRTVR